MPQRLSPGPGKKELAMMNHLKQTSTHEFQSEVERLVGQTGSGPSASRSKSASKSLEAINKGKELPRGFWKRVYQNMSDRSMMIKSIIVLLFIVTIFVFRYPEYLRINALTHGVESVNGFITSMRDYMVSSFSSLLRIPMTKGNELWTSLQQSGLYKKIGLLIGTSKEIGTSIMNSLLNLKNFIITYMPTTDTFASFGRKMKMSLSGVKHWILGSIPVTAPTQMAFPPSTSQNMLALPPSTSLPPLSSLNLPVPSQQVMQTINPKNLPVLYDPKVVTEMIEKTKNALVLLAQ